MARVVAELVEGKRIVFTARGRSQVNVREIGADGQPIGFTSVELLLMALANCTLGEVSNSPALAAVDAANLRVTLESSMAREPLRVGRIDVTVEVEGPGPAVEGASDGLLASSSGCPVANTLRFSPEIEVKVRAMRTDGGANR
jgi:uncharacterized OsmC-like protein